MKESRGCTEAASEYLRSIETSHRQKNYVSRFRGKVFGPKGFQRLSIPISVGGCI